MSELNATLDLPLGAVAPAVARKAVRHMLLAWQLTDPDWLDDAELVVSELVTNAVRYGGGCIELGIQSHEGRVIVAAADGSSVVPRNRGPHQDGGYGLRVIEASSDAWGVEDHRGGKRVWVRLRPCPSPRPVTRGDPATSATAGTGPAFPAGSFRAARTAVGGPARPDASRRQGRDG